MDDVSKWFTARGWTPFPFQREAWSAYLAGGSGLLEAPTGVGKSYAAWFGPVLEWMGEREGFAAAQAGAPGTGGDTARVSAGRGGRARRTARHAASARGESLRSTTVPLRVLWITPLRALAHDTVKTLRESVDGMRLPWEVGLRTGDTPGAERRRQRERLPTALVTTPESLSLLLSYPDTRERIGSIRCVVVDEWHELLGSKRGVQVELALARLRRWNPRLRIWGLSATLAGSGEAMQVLLGPGAAGAGHLIGAPGEKQVRIETLCPADVERFPWSGHLGLKLVDRVLEALARARTTLMFTNTRSQAELWFQALMRGRPEWLGQLALHHGSLDREVRQRVEQAVRESALRCVVCTSSLDLGVDFSPVDQVIQVGSPKGIARLLQRAGRSGHQPGAVSRILCVPTNAFELVEFSAARAAAGRRQLEERVLPERPLDVLVQHLVTVGLGSGFASEELWEEVRGTYAFRNLSREEWRWALEFLTQGGPALRAYPQFCRLADAEGRFVVASRQVARMHRMSIGTITSDTEMTVRLLGGGRLGTIEESFIARLRRGDRFVYAGRVLELLMVRDMTAYVRRASRAGGAVPRWMGGRMPLSSQLAAAVRERLDASRRGTYADAEMEAARPVLELQRAWSRIPEPGQLLIETTRSREGRHFFVYPFEGRLVHEGLGPLVAWRLTRMLPCSVSAAATDYGFELLSNEDLAIDESTWRKLLARGELVADLLACLNATELAGRQFRDIARVAGLVFSGYPHQPRPMRHLQASSDLFYRVFLEYDPSNGLLEQARREVLEQQLEIRRLQATLERIEAMQLLCVDTARFSPLAFPIWSERLRNSHVSSQRWSERVRRMVVRLEKAASRPGRARHASRAVGR